MSTAVVTEKWSGRTKSRANYNADAAQKVFQVVGATDDDDAMDNVASTAAGYPGVKVGSQFGSGSFLYCSKVQARQIAIGFHEVTADFSIGNYIPPEDPLKLPWKYDFKTVTIEPKIDRDIAGNPILNSGRDPYTEGTKRISYMTLRVSCNEAFYNYALYKQYFNLCNSDTIQMVQPNGQYSTFGPGSVFCVSIEPASTFTQKDTFVPIVKSFEIWDPAVLAIADPFQLRFLDTGSNGFYSVSGTPTSGILCKADGTPVSQDVPLNGQGLPIDTTLKIYQRGASPATAVAFGSAPTGATIENPAAGAYYLKYKRYPSTALLPLLMEPPQ